MVSGLVQGIRFGEPWQNEYVLSYEATEGIALHMARPIEYRPLRE